jgi:hypothetical protein
MNFMQNVFQCQQSESEEPSQPQKRVQFRKTHFPRVKLVLLQNKLNIHQTNEHENVVFAHSTRQFVPMPEYFHPT